MDEVQMNENPRPQWLEEIPSVIEILEEAKSELGFGGLVGKVRPSELARMLERKCHEIYRRYEERVRERWKGEPLPTEVGGFTPLRSSSLRSTAPEDELHDVFRAAHHSP